MARTRAPSSYMERAYITGVEGPKLLILHSTERNLPLTVTETLP
jgi:hypothetical protein